ncbi:MAG: Sulfate adenylyltransferase subunit 1 [Myxococcales bacterium]|nr:Sulfate adenylyltransferase subunit 1 [Myxococcales bacterium]
MTTLSHRSAHAGLDDDSDLLRFSTAGSVDDGKSTLIGRLLFDTKTAFEDQLEHVADVSRRRGDVRTNLALLTDGLRAEREQGITIDVAYRYFATKRRKFIIADTPGHVQYTRNMVTGASTASLSIVLVDARQGMLEQSRRHAYIGSLLRIPHLVFAVNKMDLVNWDEATFRRIEEEFRNFSARLEIQDITFIPISALTGANVVDRSADMPWYHGPTLLYHLETVHIASDRNLIDVRFPIQWVIRPQTDEHHDYRGYAGQVAGGVIRVGDEVTALPSGLSTKIAKLEQGGKPVDVAFPPMSVTVHLQDDLDVSRGDMLCRANNQPTVGQDLDAMICWMADKPLAVKGRYALKHTTRTTRAIVTDVLYRLDVNTGHRQEGVPQLGLNDLGRIRLRTTTPVIYDPYRRNRTTGSFILIDETTNATVAAGMLLSE